MEKECIFCKEFDKDRIIYEDDTWIAVLDAFPVAMGHTLLIPKRHCETFFDLNYIESSTFMATIGIVKMILDTKFKPNGYNVGANCGKASGQSINHCHIHIIPRYDGDVEDPLGGVRGVIPDKQKYA